MTIIKRILTLLPALALMSLLISCAKSPQEQLPGEWSATNEKGPTVSLTFTKEGGVTMRKGGDVSSGSWTLDASRGLVDLELTVADGDTQTTFLGIARLLEKDRLQLRVREKSLGRPAGFTEEKDYNQIVFVRQGS